MNNNRFSSCLFLMCRKCPVCGVEFKKYYTEEVGLFLSGQL